MAKKEKKPSDKLADKTALKLTQTEFDELEAVAGHYKKSDYARKAIKVQIASDKIRGISET